MTVAEMIEALKRFDGTDLLVVETADGDFQPMGERLARVRIGVDGEPYRCAAVGYDAWPNERYDYALEED